ncbi:acetyl-CoA carboxylase [Culex quinquefasciatus]|uniref:Acetyl-CoA carboxylase n=1 Tax=Culex quinquefasciatus TaxID=7176 RepID=B0WIJ2_CULQU|nr:acetyl-CoA carboxylase [Culex quinquefasciatus]|eukprot:XP_001848526.1 acetyl-CoA carboxylase [Culex quinquefasciatus]
MLDYVHWAYSSYDLTCLQHLELSGKVPLMNCQQHVTSTPPKRYQVGNLTDSFMALAYSDEILDLLGDMTSRRAIRTAA